MAGQVDVIISKQAIKEIQIATAQLEQLRIKILQVNKAGAKSGGVGVSDNQALTSQLATLNKLVVANNKLSVSANKRLNAIKKNTAATNQSTSANKRNANSLGGIGKMIKGGGVLYLLYKLKEVAVALVKDVFNLAKQFDSLRFALERTSNSMSEAKMNSAFMLKLSSDLGLSLVATTTRFIKFAAAARNSGLAMKDVQKIFGTMAKAGAVLGLRTDELSGVFLALEQMLSKGKVTTEELRRQLGERLPGAFGIMAASLGVTLPKLDEMLKKGELLSAEVLPGFARAVELAFGLDTVDKVETLVASQNRLTTSWQNFVKNLTGEGSVVKGFFKSIFETAEKFVKGIDVLFNSQEVGNAASMSKGFEDQTKLIQEVANKELDNQKKNGKKLADLRKNSIKALAEAEGKLTGDIAHEKVQIATKALLDYQKEIDIIEERIANERYNKTFTDFKIQENLVKEHQDKVADLTKDIESTDLDKTSKRAKNIQKRRDANEELEKSVLALNKAEGKMNATRLLAEGSTSSILKPDTKTTEKTLSEISDLTNRANVAQLQKEIEYNKEKIKISKNGSDEIIELATSNKQKEIQIAGLLADDKITSARKSADKLIEEAKKFGLKGKELDDRLFEIEKQRSIKQLIAEENKAKKIIDIRAKYESFNENQVKKRYSLEKLGRDADLADELSALRKKYNKDLETTKDKKALNKKYLLDKNKLEVKSFNLVIDLMIEEEKALASLNNGQNKYTEGLEDRLAILEGRKRVAKVDGGSSGTEEQEQFDLNMEYLEKYADAVGDLAGSIYDAKIARIDNEIQAEQDKYSVLFALAQGDAEQTRYLQIQQERDREILEKKKRKLLKKQAIFEKANALISIAVNTAIAISKAAAQTGVGFVVTTPMLLGLGALQAATVLAQPIPQFAEGGVMKEDGPALVGDGGKQEVIRTPDGKVSLTPNTDTVMNLPKGTEIFSSVEKFNQDNPSDMSNMLHSASLLASISLNQKNLEGMMVGQKELDQRLLDAMLLNTKAVKNSKSNTFVKTQKIDIAHELWKSKLLN